MLKDLKNWPDEKKKKFSMFLAIIITLIIVFGWFFIKANVKYFNQKSSTNNRIIRDITETFEKISEKFNETSFEIFGTNTQEMISTSSISTE